MLEVNHILSKRWSEEIKSSIGVSRSPRGMCEAGQQHVGTDRLLCVALCRSSSVKHREGRQRRRGQGGRMGGKGGGGVQGGDSICPGAHVFPFKSCHTHFSPKHTNDRTHEHIHAHTLTHSCLYANRHTKGVKGKGAKCSLRWREEGERQGKQLKRKGCCRRGETLN